MTLGKGSDPLQKKVSSLKLETTEKKHNGIFWVGPLPSSSGK